MKAYMRYKFFTSRDFGAAPKICHSAAGRSPRYRCREASNFEFLLPQLQKIIFAVNLTLEKISLDLIKHMKTQIATKIDDSWQFGKTPWQLSNSPLSFGRQLAGKGTGHVSLEP